MPGGDPELHAVSYSFDAALQRMCGAGTDDAVMAELSNLLHHLFRLRELCLRREGAGFLAGAAATPGVRAAMAACWARSFDTHQLYLVRSSDEVQSRFCTAMDGTLVWKPLVSLPAAPGSYGRQADYAALLDGRPVLDTLRRAFDAVADLF